MTRSKTTITISGSRQIMETQADIARLKKALDFIINKFNAPFKIIHGGARGVDQIADKLARQYNLACEVIRPNYQQYEQKIAPLKRNDIMVEKANVVICFYQKKEGRIGKGGTRYTARKALLLKRPLLEINQMGKFTYTLPQPTLF